MIKINILLISLIFIILGCTPAKPITKLETYPHMYNELPKTILILPPINQTTSIEAEKLFSTSLTEPFANNGFYILPVEVTTELLISEGIQNTQSIPTSKYPLFKKLFGADAVLITNILKWDTIYIVAASSIIVAVDYQLISTTTGEILWSYKDKIEVTNSANSKNVLSSIVETAVKTKTTKYISIAKKLNERAVSTLPFGPYHKKFNKDQKFNIRKYRKTKMKSKDVEEEDSNTHIKVKF